MAGGLGEGQGERIVLEEPPATAADADADGEVGVKRGGTAVTWNGSNGSNRRQGDGDYGAADASDMAEDYLEEVLAEFQEELEVSTQ